MTEQPRFIGTPVDALSLGSRLVSEVHAVQARPVETAHGMMAQAQEIVALNKLQTTLVHDIFVAPRRK